MVVVYLRVCCDSRPAELRGETVDTLHVGSLEGVAGNTLPRHVISRQEGVLQWLDKVEILDTTLGT